jgi:hypothetical protein
MRENLLDIIGDGEFGHDYLVEVGMRGEEQNLGDATRVLRARITMD